MAALILIAGGSCSGKTTIAHLLAARFPPQDVFVFSQDSYYRDLSPEARRDPMSHNFDHPDAIDHGALVCDVSRLLQGFAVEIPLYDFTVHRRRSERERREPVRVLILEGIFALYYPELVRLGRLRIFIDAAADLRLQRRIERDIRERGRTRESVLHQWEHTVRPMHERFVEGTCGRADIILSGDHERERIPEYLDASLPQNLLLQRISTDALIRPTKAK